MTNEEIEAAAITYPAECPVPRGSLVRAWGGDMLEPMRGEYVGFRPDEHAPHLVHVRGMSGGCDLSATHYEIVWESRQRVPNETTDALAQAFDKRENPRGQDSSSLSRRASRVVDGVLMSPESSDYEAPAPLGQPQTYVSDSDHPTTEDIRQHNERKLQDHKVTP